jgi:hypothetical protein
MKTDNNTFTLRPPTLADAAWLARNLREADRAELQAGSGESVAAQIVDALAECPPGSAWALAPAAGGSLLCLGGVRPIDESSAVIWCLGTPELDRHPLLLQKTARGLIRRYFKEHPRCRELINAVHADNTRAVAWLVRLGAVFTRLNLPVGREGALFHTFAIGRGI